MTQTIPILSIVFMAVSACISIFLPIGLLLGLRSRRRLRLPPTIAGVLIFILFVFVLESYAAAFLARIEVFMGFLTSHAWAYALYVGLMAGLFEETGRLFAFYFLFRRRYNGLGGALSYGVGHGGIEAILLAGLPLAGNLVTALCWNAGFTTPAFLSFFQTDVQTMAALSPDLFLAGGVERIIAISFHIAASVMVWLAATGRGHWGLYFLAILCHTATNFAAGLYQFGTLTNVWLVEGITAAVVLAVCLLTAWLYEKSAQTYTPLLNYDPMNFG